MFEGMVEAWDVNNEMIHGSFFVDQSGDPGIRVEMFQRAAERSPELLLFVNDYNIIAGREAATYTSLIQDLLDQGAPVSACRTCPDLSRSTLTRRRTDQVITKVTKPPSWEKAPPRTAS